MVPTGAHIRLFAEMNLLFAVVAQEDGTEFGLSLEGGIREGETGFLVGRMTKPRFGGWKMHAVF